MSIGSTFPTTADKTQLCFMRMKGPCNGMWWKLPVSHKHTYKQPEAWFTVSTLDGFKWLARKAPGGTRPQSQGCGGFNFIHLNLWNINELIRQNKQHTWYYCMVWSSPCAHMHINRDFKWEQHHGLLKKESHAQENNRIWEELVLKKNYLMFHNI